MVVNCETHKHLHMNIVIHLLMLDILFYSKTLYKHIKTRLDFSLFFCFCFYFGKILLLFTCFVRIHVCMYVQMPVNTHRGQKTVSDALELELHMVVSHLMWVLGRF